MNGKADPRRNRWHFEDMLEYAREAMSILAGRTLEQIEKDRTAQLALFRCLEVFGEAANRVALEHRALYPEMPWKDSVSTRNRLIHGYDTVRLDMVHKVITRELPPLIPVLEKILATFPKPEA